MRFLLITIILIAYGSLYPLEFFKPSDFPLRLDKLTNFNILNSGISDAFANVLLFIPFGLGLRFYYPTRSIIGLFLLALISFVLAYLIQICQLWTPSRIPYGGDAVWNVLGSLSGIFTFGALKSYFSNHVKEKWNSDVFLLLMVCLVLVDLKPFIPTFDIGLIKENVKILISFYDISVLAIIKESLFYFVLLNLFQRTSLSHIHLLKIGGALTLLVFIQIGIVDSGVNVHVVVGAIIAFLFFIFKRKPLQLGTFISLLLTLIVINAIGTLEYRAGVSFNWIPFKPALSGNTLVNIFAILEKSFFYFLYFLLSNIANINPLKSLLKLSVVVFILESFQTNIVGSTPDFTECIVVFFMAWFASKWNENRQHNTNLNDYKNLSAELLFMIRSRQAMFLGMFWLTTVITIFLVMSLPNLPYNIAEIFYKGGGLEDYSYLFLTILIFIVGIIWGAKKHSSEQLSNLKLPLYCVSISILTFLFLQKSVAQESIKDITGSMIFFRQIMTDNLFGDYGVHLVNFFGENSFKETVPLFERHIRFAALIGPFVGFLTLFLSFIYALEKNKCCRITLNRTIWALASFVPWFFICKFITIDLSSTDNLYELIAIEGDYGVGGGLFLYGLVMLITAIVSNNIYGLNNRTFKQIIISIMLLGISVPLSWLLLKNGLIGSFVKYGNTFSGVDFLIGGSRSVLLPESILMIRWSGAYLVMVLGLSGLIFIVQKIMVVDRWSENTDESQESKRSLRKFAMLKRLLERTNYTTVLSIFVVFSTGLYLSKDIDLLSIDNKDNFISWASRDANIIFDHHTHTKFSDGKLSVEELVNLGFENGCDAIAITDHTDSKRSLSKKQLDEIKLARLFNPNILVLAGAELNPPSYKGREHINVLFTPKNEKEAFAGLRNKIDDENIALDDRQLFELLNTFDVDKKNVVAIYNHPSRKDNDETENKLDYLKWSENSETLIGLSGAPGHQKSDDIGSYRGKFKPINRWDPVVAKIGGALDQLLDEGHDIWGAIASSDYHNEQMDYPPCGFSRIHVAAPEKTYAGLMKALKKGTFWASHGKFLSQFKLVAEVSEKQLRLSPGEANSISGGSIVLIEVELQREPDFIGLPLEVELITNCVTGKPELLDAIAVKAFDNKAAALIPINQTGKDGETCYLRSRVKLQNSAAVNMAYSNHIRLIID
jgi:hypothetical protein